VLCAAFLIYVPLATRQLGEVCAAVLVELERAPLPEQGSVFPFSVRVRVAAQAPFPAELLERVQVCPRAQTVHLEEVGIHTVEEEPIQLAPGSALALMVQPAHQGLLKMR
jgi:hypothetical protein